MKEYKCKLCKGPVEGEGMKAETIPPTESPKKCVACKQPPHKNNTIRVLGSGGDYEDWPCPECNPEEFYQIKS